MTDFMTKGEKLFEAITIVRLPIENRNKKPKTEKKETKNGRANKFYRKPRNHCMRNNWTIINQCTHNFSS